MPQKKNPDVLELIRAKSALVIGNFVQIAVLQKGLPSTYNRDFQEDKKILFQAFDETLSCINIFTKILKNIKIKKESIDNNIKRSFLEATDIADYLVKKGEKFRNAHKATGKLIKYCIENNKKTTDLSIKELKQYSNLFENDFFEKVSLENCVNAKITPNGTNPENVYSKIKSGYVEINNLKEDVNNLKLRIPTITEVLKEAKIEIN
jgi:argininosuccinate lyase